MSLPYQEVNLALASVNTINVFNKLARYKSTYTPQPPSFNLATKQDVGIFTTYFLYYGLKKFFKHKYVTNFF